MVNASRTLSAIEVRNAGGIYQIAIDRNRGRWEWQTAHTEPGKPTSHRVIDRGNAETYRQAVHRSLGIVMNHGEVTG